MSRDPDHDREATTRAAAHWHALHREGALSPAQHAEFARWLTASPRHLREYLAISHLAGELGLALREAATGHDAAPAQAGKVVSLRPPRPAAPPASRPPRRRLRQGLRALAATAACAAALLWAWPRSYTYASPHGEHLAVQLPDRSRVHLDSGTELRVTLDPLRRKVELRRGRASFEVAEQRRPFVVEAGGLRVRDIGTTFDVDLRAHETRIAVLEGRVQVWNPGSADAAPGLLADLGAGQRARVAHADRQVETRTEDAGTMTAWMRGELVFLDEPLADVAEALNRHNTRRIAVEDASAAALRLSGRLQVSDLDSFGDFLAAQPTLHVVVGEDEIRVGSAPAQAGAPSL
ncbi:FecR family protein [Coralloluteibacterium thermophilus]|uniref:FecR family protein n=1 Tax=Coralloluteibacterium thermophilum TaxID=2707049 RepID=A0ABV9NG50_9GAMM